MSHVLAAALVLLSVGTPALGAASPTSRTGPPASAQSRTELDRSFTKTLVELSELAARERLFGTRDRLLELVLRFEPDHRTARRTLRYHRRNGVWVRSKSYRTPVDRGSSTAAAEERFLTAYAAYRDSLLALAPGARDALQAEETRELLRFLLTLHPEDPLVHRQLGEVRGDDGWVLAETSAARGRRARIVTAARDLSENAPEPEPCGPDLREEGLVVPWRSGRRTSRVRVLGTVGEAETVRATRAVHAMGDFFEYALGPREAYRPGFTIYLLESQLQGIRLLRQWPGLSARTRAFLEDVQSGWLGDEPRVGVWCEPRRARVDAAARQTAAMLLHDTYGIEKDEGWIYEGFGLYLVHRLVGTRLMWFVDMADERQSTSRSVRELMDPDSDWLVVARQLDESNELPRLNFLLGRRVDDMGPDELVTSYAFAAFLIEGRWREVHGILRRVGTGAHPVAVLEEELGATLPGIEERFRRWLREVTGSGR